MIINISFVFLSPIFSDRQQKIRDLSETLNAIISSNNYGESIENVLIGLIAVEPIYDKFAKPRRPRYTEHKEVMALGSIPMTFHKTLEIEIKMNYEQILAAEGDKLRELVAKDILNTLHTLKLPNKVTDFDKDRFVADVESVFRSEYLIA